MQICFDEVRPSFPLLQFPSPSSQFLPISCVLFFNLLCPVRAASMCMTVGPSLGSPVISQWPHHWGKRALPHPTARICHNSSASGGTLALPPQAMLGLCLLDFAYTCACCHNCCGFICTIATVYLENAVLLQSSTASDFCNLSAPYSATLLSELSLSFYISPEKFVK